MQHLYNEAALREPEMMRQAKEAKTGQFSLFDDGGGDERNAGQRLWRPEPCWDPTSADWWSYEEYLDENR